MISQWLAFDYPGKTGRHGTVHSVVGVRDGPLGHYGAGAAMLVTISAIILLEVVHPSASAPGY